MHFELLLEKSIKSSTKHQIFISILKRKKFLNVEIALSNGVDNKVTTVRLRSQEFKDIFGDAIHFRRRSSSVPTHIHYWLWSEKSRNVKFNSNTEDFSIEIFYDRRPAHRISSVHEDLEAILDLIENNSILERLSFFEKQIERESYRPLILMPDGTFRREKS